MSGGVDSSVAAALLLERGYEVEGAFIKFWKDKKGKNTASSDEAFSDAKKVAKKLGIKLHVFDFQKEFKKQVVDYFLNSYARGQTPNPCVQCNKYIKFGEFLKRAKRLGCDYIATGHYVKKSKVKNLKSKVSQKSKVNYKLSAAKDLNKDQSYFLWTLTQSQLKHCLFPLGNYTKPQVRVIAKEKKLPVFEKDESQGICFIKDKRHYDFLRRHLKLKKGPIIALDGVPEKGIKPGSTIGQHQGLPLYTIGQRREILVGGIGPFYVLKLGYGRNTLYVANKFDKELLFKTELTAKNINWISGVEPKLPLECKARIRYLHPIVDCAVTKSDKDKIKVEFKKPQRAVTPGQSVVFYKGQEMLGGGVIEK